MRAATGKDIIIQLIVQGEAETKAAIDRTERKVAQSQRAMGGAFRDLSQSPLTEFAFGMGASAAVLGEFLALATSFSGVRMAATFKDIEIQLQAVTGSASEAKRILEQVKAIGRASPFDASEVASFAAQLLNAGVSANRLGEELKAIVDVASFANLSRENLDRFMFNLIQFKQAGHFQVNQRDVREMMHLNFPMGRVIGAAMGNPNMSGDQALNLIDKLPGSKVYDLFIKGSQLLAGGAAQYMAMASPLKMLANLFENLNFIMEPTGAILIQIMMPLGYLINLLAVFLYRVNSATGGVGGLALIILLMARGWFLVAATVRFTILKINELTAALLALSGAANRASIATGTSAGLQVASGLGAGFSLALTLDLIRSAWKLRGIRGVGSLLMGGMGGTLSKIGGFLKGFGGLGLALFGADLLGGKMESSDNPRTKAWGRFFSGFATGGSIGMLAGGAIGALIGMLGGPIGAVAGAWIGAAIGGLIGGVLNARTPAEKGATENTQKEIASTLKEIKVTLIGGGERAQNFKTQYELEQRWRIAQETGVL